jgi:type I restriction-modification system DNA methylase subunit
MNEHQTKHAIADCLHRFATGSLAENAIGLLNTMGYDSAKRIELGSHTPQDFIAAFGSNGNPNPTKALLDQWQSVHLLFQLTAKEIRGATQLRLDFPTDKKIDNTIIESYLFFAIALQNSSYTRTQLATITREVNKLFPMPSMLLFLHGHTLTFSIIDRRLHKRDQSRDVLEKVTLIKDINFSDPHRAHIEILFDLSLEEAHRRHDFTNFVELHSAWRKILDIKELNKKFYQEIANWYFWALDKVEFPADIEKDRDTRNATSLIRLITRLIFVWFMKEKGLVPVELFNQHNIQQILTSIAPNESTYYKAILQNLFFATLNTEMNKDKPASRKFRGAAKQPGQRGQHYMIHNVFRYEDRFINPQDTFEKYFDNIPFLNGGLFECLDREEDQDGARKIVRIDGFSDRSDNVLHVPNELFFSSEQEVDLNEVYGTKNKSYKVRGIINILSSYKFTVAENTPIEEEIALDPELLGRVLENLLASYNPETKTTARKQTGSYYTPREIVNYMVDESLIAYLETELKQKIPALQDMKDLGALLRDVFAYTEKVHPFDQDETAALVDAINNIRILDPACGSGAFPMGILHKLVFILAKLDPDNELWKSRQIAEASAVPDTVAREQALADIGEAFANNEPDYPRKLYLIQDCVYGVDIQPIAVQIAKLRFFISLLVNQTIDDARSNRGIIPLPNLETKLVAANSLIGLDRPAQVTLRNPAIDRAENELAEVRRRHFAARTPKTKAKYRHLDAQLRAEISQLLKQDGFPRDTTEKLAQCDPYDQNASAVFFDPEWMFGIVDGFDIAIANPPYIKEYVNRKAFDGLRDSPYYKGKMDIWYLFACQGIDYLENNGILTFIAQNNWVTSYGASKLRNKVTSDTKILALLDFGDYKIFETSGIQTMVMIFQKDRETDNYEFDYRRVLADTVSFEDILDLLNYRNNSNVEYLNPKIQRGRFTSATLTFSCSNIERLIGRIRSKANLSLNEDEIANGIHHHHGIVNQERQRVLGSGFEIGDGIFVLSNKEKQDIPFLKNELTLIKPSYTTKELHKWYGDPKNKEWVIYTGSSFKYPENIKPYPNIKAHLDKFRDVITSDNWPYGLHRAREERFFKGEKIIAVRKCAEPAFTYTDFDCYVSATFYVIKTERINLKYLTAILNSKLVMFWLRNSGKMQGNNYQIDKEPLLAIPVFKASNQEQQSVITLVDQILFTTKGDDSPNSLAKQAKVKEYEGQIDQMVYQLYDLTPEEKALVQLFNSKK